MKIAVLILAAGTASRMKTAKQLLPIGGKTLLGISIENAQKTNAENVFCVLGANADQIKCSITNYKVEIIENLDFQKGLGSSISCGIKNLDKHSFDAVLIILGDQPNVTSEYLNALISNFEKSPEFIFASKYGTKNGVPAIFPRLYFPDLLKLQGEKGAADLLNSELIIVKTIEMTPDVTDIDTPEDYKKFVQ
ncbi:nucleotidyltransferase family protein [Halpernia sp. GG3]